MDKPYLAKILSSFQIEGELQVDSIEAKTNGNINKTYVATYDQGRSGVNRFLLQKINAGVFTEPYKLMKNINQVTEHSARKLEEAGDTTHKTLTVVKTLNGQPLYVVKDHAGENDYYRVYPYIEGATSYDETNDLDIVKNAGRAIGHFHGMFNDYDMDDIEETIPDFHHTAKRYKKFKNDFRMDAFDRADSVAKDIFFVVKRGEDCSAITDRIEDGTIPLRVIHNDTKLNNILFDAQTNDFVGMIDLDTVMPGYVGYDWADGARVVAAKLKEDDPRIDMVGLDMDKLTAFTEGYLSEASSFLLPAEVKYLGKSLKVITLELGMRFLNDYINGDTYFKTDYPDHNLVRARNQFALVKDIEKNEKAIESHIQKVYKMYK